ncbi:MAG: peptidylprolyl isomerase [Caulobacterales bacterium]|nr:peptidylprolyl isomerase [Caulobacterales bacterium]
MTAFNAIHVRSLLAGAAALAAAACETEAPPPPSDFTGAVVRLGDAVAAEVDGSPIYVSDVRREGAAQGVIDPAEPLDPASPAFDQLLEELIDQRLMALEAVRRGLHESDEARRRVATARERILGNILVETVVDDAVTEDNVRRMFDEQVKLVELGEEVRASHIVVETEDQARDILSMLQAGVSFEQLALDRSLDDSTRLEGGDLGYVTPDMVTAPIARAAFSTRVGEIAPPFQTEFGWHVLIVADRRAEERPTFEEMRPRIVRFMTFDEIHRLVEVLRDRSDVRRLAGGAGGEQAGPPSLRQGEAGAEAGEAGP